MANLATRSSKKHRSIRTCRRIAKNDRADVSNHIDPHGNFIWALAKKFTTSDEEAEAAALEIFIDIWRYATRRGNAHSHENLVVSMIARRRLSEYLR